MKISIILKTAAASVGAVAIGIASTPTASAYSTIGKFGTAERLYDAGGRVVTAWTVSDLRPSSDKIPAYPLRGRL